MEKIIVTNRKTGALIHESPFNENGCDQAWLDKELRLNSWGKPARWLTEPLEGVETRVVVDQEAYASCEVPDCPLNSCETCTHAVVHEEVNHLEYLHPAEYVYDIQPYVESYKIIRRREYEAAGLTAEAWSIATIERDIDGDSAKYEEMKAKKKEIQAKAPKT